MAWHEKSPRHAGIRDWMMMGWVAVSLVAALWATGRAVDYFASYSDMGLTIGSLGVGTVAFLAVYYIGKAIIRPASSR